MKKIWGVALSVAALFALLLCWGRAMNAQQGEEPVLTQQMRCIVLAKRGREIVVQTAERAGTELRTVRLAKAPSGASEQQALDDAVQVGDLVQMETELHSDNTETLRSLEVLSAGTLTAQEAADLLAGAQQKPQAVAVTAPSEALPAADSASVPDSESSAP